MKNDVGKNYVYKAKIKDVEDKISDITKHKIPTITTSVTNASFNATINEVKNEIPGINNLAATTALTIVEIIIPNIGKYITTPEYNARLKLANLATKDDIADFMKKIYFDDKLRILF